MHGSIINRFLNEVRDAAVQVVPLEIVLATGATEPTLAVSFTPKESDQPRPMALRRFLLPCPRAKSEGANLIGARSG